jgi:hypothetical protein
VATPCSVSTYGAYFRCFPRRPVSKASNWLLKETRVRGRELEREVSWKTPGIAATNGEQTVLWRGTAAGTIVGLALGLMIALFIAMKPELFAGLIR